MIPNIARNSRLQFIAFHNGHLITDYILDYIIDAAMRGLMTVSAEKLLLIPDTRKGPADLFGLRFIGKFLKSDCITLKQLNRKMRKSPNRQKSPENGPKT